MGWEQSHIPVLGCGMIYFLFYAMLKKLAFLNHPWRFYARAFLIPPLLTYSLLSYSSIAPLHAFVYSALFYTRDEITYYCSILPFFYLDCTYWSLHCKYFRTTMSCNSLLANVVCFTCTTLNKALSYLILSYLIVNHNTVPSRRIVLWVLQGPDWQHFFNFILKLNAMGL